MKYIGKTPEELDKEFDEYQFSYNIKSIKKDGKVKVIATGALKINGEEETLTTQCTKENWISAFEGAIDQLNKKAEEKTKNV